MLLQTKCCTLFPIIRFRSTNTLKTKMAPLSSIINYKDQTIYKDDNICKGLLEAIFLVIIKYLIEFLDCILLPQPKPNSSFSRLAHISENFSIRVFYKQLLNYLPQAQTVSGLMIFQPESCFCLLNPLSAFGCLTVDFSFFIFAT